MKNEMKSIVRNIVLCSLPVFVISCGEEPVSGPDVPVSDESVYMEVGLSLSAADNTASGRTSVPEARSATGDPSGGYVTSDSGTETGKPQENAIAELLLVIADSGDKNIAAALLEDASGSGTLDYVIPVPFHLLKDHAGEQVHVYVFCNPTDKLKSLAENVPGGGLPEDFVDMTHTVSDLQDDPAWESGHFLMSNATMCVTTLPDDWSDYRSISSPFSLTGAQPLAVERMVARFDYKTVKTDNIYPVSSNPDDINETENPGVMVQLTDAAFFNVARSFWYLRRVADEGLTDISVCGAETADNYVVDPYAESKMAISEDMTGETDFFHADIEDPDSWDWTPLADLADTEEDSEWGNDAPETRGYHIWRYIPENASPKQDFQGWNISTGIAFRGRIVSGTGCDPELKAVLDGGTEPVYVYKGILYGSWDMVQAAGETNEDLKVAWNAVENNGVSYSDAGFTVYDPDENGDYETYYFHRNVHNDNGIDDPESADYLCPMKFAVVRNNVYKLAVQAIFSFGLTDNTPVEDEYAYMMMTVEVLPWVTKEYEIIIEE